MLFFLYLFFYCHSFAVPSEFEPPLHMFAVFLFSVLHQPHADEKINNLGHWDSRFHFLLCPSFRWLRAVFVFTTTHWIFFLVHFLYNPLSKYSSTHLSKPALKSFCCFPKAHASSAGWNNSYGNRDAFWCNTSSGCSPSYLLCSKEFPEHAAGEREIPPPAHCLILLSFPCASFHPSHLFVQWSSTANHIVPIQIQFYLLFLIPTWLSSYMLNVHALLFCIKKSFYILKIHLSGDYTRVVVGLSTWNKTNLINY